jgi:hypothetical protein
VGKHEPHHGQLVPKQVQLRRLQLNPLVTKRYGYAPT